MVRSWDRLIRKKSAIASLNDSPRGMCWKLDAKPDFTPDWREIGQTNNNFALNFFAALFPPFWLQHNRIFWGSFVRNSKKFGLVPIQPQLPNLSSPRFPTMACKGCSRSRSRLEQASVGNLGSDNFRVLGRFDGRPGKLDNSSKTKIDGRTENKNAKKKLKKLREKKRRKQITS